MQEGFWGAFSEPLAGLVEGGPLETGAAGRRPPGRRGARLGRGAAPEVPKPYRSRELPGV